MRGSKILITGPTGQVASPIAKALAADNEVWGIARFTNPAVREDLEKAGVRCEAVNLAAGDFSGSRPTSTTCSTWRWPRAAAGTKTCKPTRSRWACSWRTARASRASCTARRVPSMTRRTTDPNRRAPPSATTTRSCSPPIPSPRDRRRGGCPVNGARSGRAHDHRPPQRPIRRQRRDGRSADGDDAGRHPDTSPARRDGEARPDAHEDDIIATIPKLLEVASIPATTVDWCGRRTVSLQSGPAISVRSSERNRCIPGERAALRR